MPRDLSSLRRIAAEAQIRQERVAAYMDAIGTRALGVHSKYPRPLRPKEAGAHIRYWRELASDPVANRWDLLEAAHRYVDGNRDGPDIAREIHALKEARTSLKRERDELDRRLKYIRRQYSQAIKGASIPKGRKKGGQRRAPHHKAFLQASLALWLATIYRIFGATSGNGLEDQLSDIAFRLGKSSLDASLPSHQEWKRWRKCVDMDPGSKVDFPGHKKAGAVLALIEVMPGIDARDLYVATTTSHVFMAWR
jgi:hypothetical protein